MGTGPCAVPRGRVCTAWPATQVLSHSCAHPLSSHLFLCPPVPMTPPVCRCCGGCRNGKTGSVSVGAPQKQKGRQRFGGRWLIWEVIPSKTIHCAVRRSDGRGQADRGTLLSRLHWPRWVILSKDRGGSIYLSHLHDQERALGGERWMWGPFLPPCSPTPPCSGPLGPGDSALPRTPLGASTELCGSTQSQPWIS